MSFEGLSSDCSWLSFLCVLFDVVLYMTAIYRKCTVLTSTIYMFQIFVLMMFACTLYPPWYLLEVNCVKYIHIYFFYTKPRVVMGPALPLQLASRVVILTTCDAASGGTIGIVAALAFQCSCTCLNAFMFQTKWFERYRYTVYNRSLHISRPVFSKQPRKDTPWLTCKGEVWEVFQWLIVWSELWLCSACFCSILRGPTVI